MTDTGVPAETPTSPAFCTCGVCNRGDNPKMLATCDCGATCDFHGYKTCMSCRNENLKKHRVIFPLKTIPDAVGI